MKKIIVISILSILILLSFVSAEKTVKTITVPLGFEAIAAQNNIYYYNMSIDYPDGIERVLAMEVLVTGDYQANTISYAGFLVGENVVYCNPNDWTIYISSNNYEMSFDCTPLLEQANWQGGNLTFVMMSNQLSANVKTRVRVTYENKPKISLVVHGTEYYAGQVAKVWLQLLNENNTEIDDALCTVNIYTPDNLPYITNGIMTYAGHDGVYSYDFVTPLQQGVYPAIAECYYSAIQNPFLVNSSLFLVGSETNTYIETHVLDGNTNNVREASDGGTKRFEIYYNISSFCAGYDPNYLTGGTVYWYGRWASTISNDDVTFSWYNYSSGQYVELSNTVESGLGGYITVTNSMDFTNTTDFGITPYDGGPVSIRIQDNAGIIETSTDSFYTDYFYVACNELSDSNYQVLRGSSEAHITGEVPYTTTIDRGIINSTIGDHNGVMDFHYTVGSGTTITSEELISLDLYLPFNSHHITNVSYYNGTDYEELDFYTTQPFLERTQVNFYLDLEPKTNYDIIVRAENWWKQTINTQRIDITLANEFIEVGCYNYQLANNLTNFTIPINETINKSLYDNLYLSCLYFFDGFHHYNSSIQSINELPDGEYTPEQMEYLEGLYVHLEEVGKNLISQSTTISNGWLAANAYSLAILNDPYPPNNSLNAVYFSSISTSYLQYLKSSGLSQEVWEYQNRTLTEPVNITEISINDTAEQIWVYTNRTLTNATNIAPDIWGTNSTINSGLLLQITETIWSYVARYIHGEIV